MTGHVHIEKSTLTLWAVVQQVIDTTHKVISWYVSSADVLESDQASAGVLEIVPLSEFVNIDI